MILDVCCGSKMTNRDYYYYKKQIKKAKDQRQKEKIIEKVVEELIYSIEECNGQSPREVFEKLKRYNRYFVELVSNHPTKYKKDDFLGHIERITGISIEKSIKSKFF